MKRATSEKIPIHVRIRKDVLEKLRAYVESTYGSPYGHLGDLVSDAVEYYLTYVLKVGESLNLISPHSGKKNFGENFLHGTMLNFPGKEVKHKSKKQKILKICKELLKLTDGEWYSTEVLDKKIRSVINVVSRPTVKNYKEFLYSKRVIIFNIKERRRKFKVNHERLKEVIKELEKEISE